jgi:hypothetical protein
MKKVQKRSIMRAGVEMDRRGRVLKANLFAADMVLQAKRVTSGAKGMIRYANRCESDGEITREQRDKLVGMAGHCQPGYWWRTLYSMKGKESRETALAHRHRDRHLRGA